MYTDLEYQLKQAGQCATSSLANQAVPKEPGIIDRLRQSLEYLAELRDVHGTTLRMIVSQPQSGTGPDKQAGEPSLEDMVRAVCEQCAMAVGAAKTIRGRF